MKKIITFLLMVVTMLPSIEAQSKKDKKALKKEEEALAYSETKTLIESGAFDFEAYSLTTQKGKRIDLTTNANFLTIKNSKGSARLPYFGTVQVANMSGESGIVFENAAIENYSIKFKDKKQKIIIKFKVQSGHGELLTFTLTVFKGGTTSVSVFSSQRNSISYDGAISLLES